MRLALAGDTMLGRQCGERLGHVPADAMFDSGVADAARDADLFVLNLECCISDRGERFPDPFKPFFFRAPPAAVAVLQLLGVDAVTLANNHALDYGPVALLDTLRHLDDAGIAHVGAGRDRAAARHPIVLEHDRVRLGIIALTDHPAEFAADDAAPGVAFADLRHRDDSWVIEQIDQLDADLKLVSPHWGPNMTTEPVPHVMMAASAFRRAGATLVAGHSAHVFHGVGDQVVYDLGDFIDDYARDRILRNDLGLLFLVTFDDGVTTQVEMVPLALDHCRTRLADQAESAWIADRMRRACAALGTVVERRGARLVVHPGSPAEVPT